jgi:hypothetical protein
MFMPGKERPARAAGPSWAPKVKVLETKTEEKTPNAMRLKTRP